jgi:hypothetical protein
MIPYLQLSIPNCIDRVEAMNRRYTEADASDEWLNENVNHI